MTYETPRRNQLDVLEEIAAKTGSATIEGGVTIDNGTAITGATMPTGGSGPLGWLSAIWTKLSGTLAISAASLPLPTGAATSAKQDELKAALGTPLQAGGNVAVTALPASGSTVNATIASGASLSGVIDLGTNQRLSGIILPGAWTSATLTFRVSPDGVNFFDLYDETGTEVSYTVVAGKSMRVPFADWIGVRYLKIRSGTTGTPVNQAADRAFTLVTA